MGPHTSGNEAASEHTRFDDIVRELRTHLVRFLTRMVGEADAEDVVQTTLSKASDSFCSFRGEASARTWLFRIAANAARDWLRSRPRHEMPDGTGDEDEQDDAPDEDASQERRLIREEMSQCIAGVFHRLPESYQVVLALSDCEELPDREIASIVGITEGAAKVRLHRARTRLKRELEAACTFYRDDRNVLCCDRKEAPAEAAYRFAESARLQSGRQPSLANDLKEEPTMTTIDVLSPKQKNLIGVGASIAAGCRPCTLSFASAARETGSCDRGVRFAADCGLAASGSATAQMASFVGENFRCPEIEAAFRADRAMLEALIGVASAITVGSASLVTDKVAGARAAGATDEHIKAAVEIGRKTRRGAEREADNALNAALGVSTGEAGCCQEAPAKPAAGCGCGCT